MSNFDLNSTWDHCLAMWKWISENYKGDMDPYNMKAEWLKAHRFTKPRLHDCFFCDYAGNIDGIGVDCSKCPAFGNKKRRFACENHRTYNWRYKPKAFYTKIKELNEIRLKNEQ